MKSRLAALSFLALLATSNLARAGTGPAPWIDYFVAVDALEILASGTFAGLPNPNFGRLTLLVAHRSAEDPTRNHFHSIGAYSYATIEGGPPFVISTSTNNRIPEISTGLPPLPLHRGRGPFSGRWISKATESEYSRLPVASIQSLADAPPGSPDGILFRSSAGRWTRPLDGVFVALQRVSLTPDFRVTNERGQIVFGRVLRHPLGEGNTLRFSPMYSAPGSAEPRTYSATLKLVDISGASEPLGDSGRFTFDFAVVQLGDLDADSDVDRDDLQAFDEAAADPFLGSDDPRDLNEDGAIDATDRRILAQLVRRAFR